MKVKFYGTRGSIPISDSDSVQVGGNTSCVLITFQTGRIGILDAGTGIRRLGDEILAKKHEQYDNIFIGLSHTHWDHIQGFPFFKPAYDPKRHFTIAICGKERHARNLDDIFETLMQQDYFPVTLDKMGATFKFWEPDTTQYTTSSGVTITASKHNHTGDAYSYRIEEGGKTLVYCTDIEHGDGLDLNVVAIARNADLLIHDAQYTPEELKDKRGWGHSSWEQAVAVAKQAGVKKLALFHHDPEHNDTFLFNIEKESRKHFSNTFLARDDLEVEI